MQHARKTSVDQNGGWTLLVRLIGSRVSMFTGVNQSKDAFLRYPKIHLQYLQWKWEVYAPHHFQWNLWLAVSGFSQAKQAREMRHNLNRQHDSAIKVQKMVRGWLCRRRISTDIRYLIQSLKRNSFLLTHVDVAHPPLWSDCLWDKLHVLMSMQSFLWSSLTKEA